MTLQNTKRQGECVRYREVKARIIGIIEHEETG